MKERGDWDAPWEWSLIVSVIGIPLTAFAFAGAARMLRSEREAETAARARAPARVLSLAGPQADRPASALSEAWELHAKSAGGPLADDAGGGNSQVAGIGASLAR